MMNGFEPAKWSPENRIIALIAYFDIFDLALSREFINKYVFGNNSNLDLVLDQMTGPNGILGFQNQLYHLKDRQNLTTLYSFKSKLSEDYLEKCRKWSKWFRSIPFVEMVAVCNYLPFKVVENDSDIDLLVVTKPGRIFLARVFLTAFTQLLGVRRHGKRVKGRFCLSFYINASELDLEPVLLDKEDIYMSFWMLGLYPVYDNGNSFEEIFEKNINWLKLYFDDPLKSVFKRTNTKTGKNLFAIFCEFLFNGGVGNRLENRLERYFVKRHNKNFSKLSESASIEISSSRLKFHNQDKRDYFRKQWWEKLKRLGVS